MKKLRKRWIALLLCGLMLFSDVSAAAAHAEEPTAAEAEEIREGHVHNDGDTHGEEAFNGDESGAGQGDGDVTGGDVTAGDVTAGDPPGVEEPRSEPTDLTTPVIRVEGELKNGSYCEAPAVTVTDEGNNLAQIILRDGSGPKEYTIAVGKEEQGSKEIRISDYIEDIVFVRKLDIVATDEAGNTYSKSFYAGHTVKAILRYKFPATCAEKEKSVHVYICGGCGIDFYQANYYVSDSLQPEHEFREETVTENGCGGAGTLTRKTCEVCGYVETVKSEDYVEGTDHQWETHTRAADCTRSGFTWEECSKCHDVKNVKILRQLCHVYGSYRVVEKATCETPGKKEAVCTREGCNAVNTVVIPAGHLWVRTEVEAPTCQKTGYTALVCSECHMEKEGSRNTLQQTQHSYEDDGDCTTASVCKFCGIELVEQQQHKLDKYVASEAGHYQKCQNPGCRYDTRQEGEVLPHSYSHNSGPRDCTYNWICSECGYTVKGNSSHTLGEWQSDGTYHWQECVNCDHSTRKEAHVVKDDYDCTTAKSCSVCGRELEAAKEHNWSEKYNDTISYHWRVCTNEGCRQRNEREEHQINWDRRDCTESLRCQTCSYVAIHGEITHRYAGAPVLGDEEGHYQICQNGNCEVVKRLTEGHSGGTATCQSPAECEICHQPYGEKDTTHHVGSVFQDERPATTEQEGYTGDEVCTACGTVIKKGETIPKLEVSCEHEWVKKYDDEKCWEECARHCGATRNEIKHTLEQHSDEGGHWQQCRVCKYATTKVPHVSRESEIDTDCTTRLTCGDCGYVIEEAKEGHNFDETLVFDETGHWHVCTNPGCSQISVKTDHRTDDNHDCTSAVKCIDCGHTLVEGQKEHNWSTVWQSDEKGHFHRCLNTGCQQLEREDHIPVEDDRLCTTPIVCSVCNRVITAAEESHNFGGIYYHDETGHWQKCQNEGCDGVDAEHAHSGGTATCRKQAICMFCGAAYGSTDEMVHEGSLEVRGYVPPTTESEGYSGDTYCLGCEKRVAEGEVLARLSEDHEHVFDGIVYFDDTHHWTQCRCGMHSSYRTHKLGEWQSDNTHHWKVCEYDQCGYIVRENHQYEQGICVVCNALQPDYQLSEDLWIVPIGDYTYTGKAVTPQIHVFNGTRRLVQGTDYTVKYKNNTKVGTAKVIVTGKGNYKNSMSAEFSILPKDLGDGDIVADALAAAANKKVQHPVPALTWNGRKLKNGADFTVSYPSSGENAYKDVGEYQIAVHGKGNFSGSLVVGFTVTGNKPVNKLTVERISDQSWTGQEITPQVTVRDGKSTLVKGVDYDVTYENNQEVGTAAAVITGMGSYAGIKRVTFRIVGSKLNKASVTGVRTDLVYCGEELRQDESGIVLTVGKGADQKILRQDVDYTVSYANNIKPGKASVIFTGINGYKGSSLKKTFTIRAYDLASDEENKVQVTVEKSVVYSKDGARPKVKVTFDGETLTAGRDYTLSYANNRAVGGETDKKSPAVIIKGKGCFAKTMAPVKFTIAAKPLMSLSDHASAQDKVWTGRANSHTTAFTLTEEDGTKLKAGTDYKVSYYYAEETTLLDGVTVRAKDDEVKKTDRIPVNTRLYVLASQAKNPNYFGSVSAEFCLVKSSVARAKVTIPDQMFTGSAIELDEKDIKVMLGGRQLAPDEYEIVEGSYVNNVKKGVAKLTIRGCTKECGGTKTVTFKIVQKPMK